MAEATETIVDALRGVYDPCCRDKGISVVDMGLLRAIRVDGARARVELVLTTGWCPFASHLLTSIQERIAALPGIGDATVEVVWDEAWTADRLSEDARVKLRFLPDPAAVADRDRYIAARQGEGGAGAPPEGGDLQGEGGAGAPPEGGDLRGEGGALRSPATSTATRRVQR